MRRTDSLEHDLPVEHFFNCPYCGEQISMVLDLTVQRQAYVEDCEVCCNPIGIRYSVEDEALASFDAKILE
jgi:transcription elongation factor Elf1